MSFGIIIRGKSSPSNKLTMRDLNRANPNREDHEYRHFNRAMGIPITGKAHYLHEMNKRGLVPFETGEKLAEASRKNSVKPYDDISEKTKKAIGDLKASVGRNGKLSSLEGTKRCMESVGVSFDHRLPECYRDKSVGGFE